MCRVDEKCISVLFSPSQGFSAKSPCKQLHLADRKIPCTLQGQPGRELHTMSETPPAPVAVLGRPGCPCTDQEADGNTAAAKCKRANTKSKQIQCSSGTVYKRWLTQLCVLRLLLVCTILKCKRSCMGLTALNLWAGSPVHIQTASSGNQTPCSQSYLLLPRERNQQTKCPEPSLFTETSSCPQHHKTTPSLPQPPSVSCGQQISYLLSHTRPFFSHFCLLKELWVLLSYKVNTSLSATQHFLPGISKLPLS